jgi:CheY-like chemotaxis protein
MLSRTGHEYRVVENGIEAVEAFRSGPFEIVLMDLHMPLMDGFEAARRIRDLNLAAGDGAAPRPVTVVAVTADTRDPRTREGGDLFDDVLVKPIQRSDLLRLLGTGPLPKDIVKVSPDGEILDCTYGLRAAGGVWGQFLFLVKLFLKHTPDLMSRLALSVQSENYEETALHAHSLQGSAAAIGGLQLSAAAGKLTHAARSLDDWSEVQALLKTVDSQWTELKTLLDEMGTSA